MVKKILVTDDKPADADLKTGVPWRWQGSNSNTYDLRPDRLWINPAV